MADPAASGHRFEQPEERMFEKLSIAFSPVTSAFVDAARRNDPLIWWGSLIASRSVSGTPLPLNVAFALVAIERMKASEWHGDLVFVCRSAALRRVILAEASRLQIEWSSFGRLDAAAMQAKVWVRPFIKITQFFASTVQRWLQVRFHGLQLPNSRSAITLIRSWCTSSNISADGRYRDRNFGVLPEILTGAGHDVWLTPCLLRMDMSFQEILRRMQRSGTRFLVVERAVSLGDIVQQAVRGYKETRIRFGNVMVEGSAMTPLFQEAVRQCAVIPDLMSFNLAFAAFRRLAARGCQIRFFLYPMENNPFEKLPLIGMKRFQPKGLSIGFQHSAWFKNQFSMRLVDGESAMHPLPDRIMCMGSRYLKVLEECGFPRERLHLAPSYRFTYTIDKPALTTPHVASVASILVLPGFDPDQANEMLLRTLRAARLLQQRIAISVKPHPTSDVEFMKKLMTMHSDVDCSVELSDAMHAVDTSTMVIDGGGSTAGLETILRAKPLLRVAASSSYFFDPLWEDYPIPIAFDEKQLASNVRSVLNGEIDFSRLRLISEIVRRGYFQPDDGRSPV
jgi:surface carbohydrate biosynthesis protein (TIGR04326 family)